MRLSFRGVTPLHLGAEIGFGNRPVALAIDCSLAGGNPTTMFLDTGCELSIVGGDLAATLLTRCTSLGREPLYTRLRPEPYMGDVVRCSLHLHSDPGGSDLEFEVRLLLARDWPGPPVLGFNNALDRIQFAIVAGSEPGAGRFYFGLTS